MTYYLTPDGTADRSLQRNEINESVSCEMCGNGFASTFRTVKAHYSDDYFTIAKCKRCGLIFVNPRLNSGFRDFCYCQEKHLVGWFQKYEAQSRERARLVLDLLSQVGCQGGNLLEVGCGIGTFLSQAQASGFSVTGIEPNDLTADYAARKHRILHDDFYKAGLPDESLDVVVMEQTLEHLGEPLAAISKAWRLLRPSGYLYLGVPGVDWLRLSVDWIGGKPKSSDLWSPEDHLYYFTPTTMKRLLTAAGFRPLDCSKTRFKWRVKNRLGLSTGLFLGQKVMQVV